MKKSSYQKIFSEFRAEMALHNQLAAEFRQAAFKVGSGIAGKHKVIEALAVKAYADWEVFTEDLLVGCLNRDTSRYAEHKGMKLSKHLSRDLCELMVTGLGYLDVKDVGNLKGIANRVLVPAYNPFGEIDGADARSIDDFCKIRNYLSHGSRQAKIALERVYQDRHGVNRFVEPGKFLFAIDRQEGQGKLTRLQVYLSAFSTAAEDMAGYLLRRP